MTIGDKIRSMSDEELAEYLIDIAYDNVGDDLGNLYLTIPSPFGGYIAVGLIDSGDMDILVKALKEDAPSD